MGAVARAIVSPLSIIDRNLGRMVLQVVAVVAAFIPGGQPVAAAAALALATLFKPKGPKPEQQERAIKTALPPRVSAYGTVRLYGAYILYDTNEDGYACDAWAFHDGRVNAILRRYLRDVRVTLNGSGYVQKKNGEFGDGDTIRIGTRLGLATETAFSELIARIPEVWSTNHRGDGVVTGCMISKPVKSKHFNDVYPSGGPDSNVLSLVVEAQRVFDWRDPAQDPDDPSTWAFSDNAALCTAHYYMTRAYKDWSTHFLPTVDSWTAAADDCDAAMPLFYGSSITMADADDGDHTVTLENVRGLAAGKVVTISTSETNTVQSISGNSVTFVNGFADDYPEGTYMQWEGGGTEARYRVALAHKHTDAHKVTIGNLLACWDGFVAPRADGALVAWSGRYVAPDPDDLIGPDEIVSYSWDYGVVDEDQFNEVAISYLSANHGYTTVDASAWQDLDAISAAGETKSTTLENSVPSHAQARRLAKRLMAKTMAANRGSITTNSRGRKIRGKRFIPLHIEEAGAVFFSGTAEIVRLRRNLSTGGVTFDWIKADPNVDEWNPATEEGEPAPVGNRVAPQSLGTPVITSATAELDASGTGARVRIIAEGYDRDDITWFTRWRSTTDASWNEQEYTDIEPGTEALLVTSVVPVDIAVDVAVAYSIGDGRVSTWSASSTVSTSTANLAPAPNTAFTATGDVGHATGGWSNSTSSNFGHSELWIGTSPAFGGASQIGADYTGGAGVAETFDEALSAGTYYLWSIAFNASDTASARTGPIEVTVT
ncbi:hypothetical protein [Novosphingobium sp. KA1]|uniref:hypothetical protein n=1 Tax=Novosphingobium sp. (strain KA1) TaxID=164608 RepID=UPI001A8DD15E|nr:hypothetical protein [Novosphingobium sp. KA1]QSR18400.1 hypothetical protein CA833_14590 [Novosphingobium sp. KA1]